MCAKALSRLPAIASGFRKSESMEEKMIESPMRDKCYTTSIQYGCGHITDLHYITHIGCKGIPLGKLHCDNVAPTPKVMFSERNCYDCDHPKPVHKIIGPSKDLPPRAESQATVNALIVPSLPSIKLSRLEHEPKYELKEKEVGENSWVDVGVETEVEAEDGWLLAS